MQLISTRYQKNWSGDQPPKFSQKPLHLYNFCPPLSNWLLFISNLRAYSALQMHPVYNLNGPIGGKESWCKGFAHPECDREDPESAPSLTQIQCLHFEHVCTQCTPDVIGQNSRILKSTFSASNAFSLYIERTNRR